MSRQPSRRSILRSALAGTVALSASTLPGTAGALPISGTWHQRGNDAGNTNATDQRPPQFDPQLQWELETDAIGSVPLVTEELVLVLEFPGGDVQVRAIDREEGETKWTAPAEGAVTNVLATDEERAYVTHAIEPVVRAIDLEDGTTQWERTLPEPAGGVRVTPRVVDGGVYVLDRATGDCFELDAESGDVRAEIPASARRFAVAGEEIVATRGSAYDRDRGLAFVDGEDPEDTRSYEFEARPGRPTVGEEFAFVGTDDETLHAIGREDTEQQFTVETDGWAVSLALADGVLLARSNEELLAVDAAGGETLWRAEPGEGRPSIASGSVFLGRPGGYHSYDLETGEEDDTFRLDGLDADVHALSVVRNGLYAVSTSGHVFAVGEEVSI